MMFDEMTMMEASGHLRNVENERIHPETIAAIEEQANTALAFGPNRWLAVGTIRLANEIRRAYKLYPDLEYKEIN